jgi:hypothetical protein
MYPKPIIMTIPIPEGITVEQSDTEIYVSGPPLRMTMLRMKIEFAFLRLEMETGVKRQFLNIQPQFVEETAY